MKDMMVNGPQFPVHGLLRPPAAARLRPRLRLSEKALLNLNLNLNLRAKRTCRKLATGNRKPVLFSSWSSWPSWLI